MARYIDADALTEVLQEWRDTSSLNDGAGNPVDSILYDVIRHIEDAPTAEVAPRAGWISVEERLPSSEDLERSQFHNFLVANEFGEVREAVFTGKYFAKLGSRLSGVTHWMPLPEPPKAKKPKAKQPKDSENYEKKRLLAGDCFHGEIWCRCPYCLTGIEAHSIPKDRICHNCGKEYL